MARGGVAQSKITQEITIDGTACVITSLHNKFGWCESVASRHIPHHGFAHGSFVSARALFQLGQSVITDAEQAGQKCGGRAEPDRSWWQSAIVHTALSVAIFNLSIERLAKGP